MTRKNKLNNVHLYTSVKMLVIHPQHKANFSNLCSAESTWTVIMFPLFCCYFEDMKRVN